MFHTSCLDHGQGVVIGDSPEIARRRRQMAGQYLVPLVGEKHQVSSLPPMPPPSRPWGAWSGHRAVEETAEQPSSSIFPVVAVESAKFGESNTTGTEPLVLTRKAAGVTAAKQDDQSSADATANPVVGMSEYAQGDGQDGRDLTDGDTLSLTPPCPSPPPSLRLPPVAHDACPAVGKPGGVDDNLDRGTPGDGLETNVPPIDTGGKPHSSRSVEEEKFSAELTMAEETESSPGESMEAKGVVVDIPSSIGRFVSALGKFVSDATVAGHFGARDPALPTACASEIAEVSAGSKCPHPQANQSSAAGERDATSMDFDSRLPVTSSATVGSTSPDENEGRSSVSSTGGKMESTPTALFPSSEPSAMPERLPIQMPAATTGTATVADTVTTCALASSIQAPQGTTGKESVAETAVGRSILPRSSDAGESMTTGRKRTLPATPKASPIPASDGDRIYSGGEVGSSSGIAPDLSLDDVAELLWDPRAGPRPRGVYNGSTAGIGVGDHFADRATLEERAMWERDSALLERVAPAYAEKAMHVLQTARHDVDRAAQMLTVRHGIQVEGLGVRQTRNSRAEQQSSVNTARPGSLAWRGASVAAAGGGSGGVTGGGSGDACGCGSGGAGSASVSSNTTAAAGRQGGGRKSDAQGFSREETKLAGDAFMRHGRHLDAVADVLGWKKSRVVEYYYCVWKFSPAYQVGEGYESCLRWV